MIDFLNYLINGSLVGLLYALIAMGFIVIYRASKVFNFAQGGLVVLRRLHRLVDGDPKPDCHCSGRFRWRWRYRRYSGLSSSASFSRLVGGVQFRDGDGDDRPADLIRGLILLIFGPQVRPFPIIFALKPVIIGDILIPRSLLIGRRDHGDCRTGPVVVLQQHPRRTQMTAVAFFFFFFFFFFFEDHQVALSMGISVKRSIAFAWALGAVLSTLGAIIYLSGKSLNFLASDIGLSALPVALLAGDLESIAGVLLAGLIVGAVQGLVTALGVDPVVGGAVGSVFPFVIMLVILFIRPTGMFGWRTIERV